LAWPGFGWAGICQEARRHNQPPVGCRSKYLLQEVRQVFFMNIHF
jgi:hypothetical protein